MKKIKYIFAIFLMGFSSLGASALEIGVGKGQIINLKSPASHVFIADPEIADVDVRSPNYIYVYGLRAGETSLHALDANNQQILKSDIIVSQNFSSLSKILKDVLPDSAIRFSAANNGLIMQGEVATPEDAQKAVNIVTSSLDANSRLVNMLKVRGSDQVMLRVRVAEVSRSELKNFGINLAEVLSTGSFGFSFLTGRAFAGAGGVLIRDGNNISVSGQTGNHNITGVIDALETQGLVKILAEPNLTARSGESASFLAGGEYPIPVPQEDGVITIEYREFGVRLEFTPTVLSNDKISLRVAPEVSALTSSAVTINDNDIPTLSIRRANTTVDLGSGESFAIAGLMRNDSSNDVNKFPWLGDLPILGALFKSNDYQRNETELVIIITPFIVRGVAESEKLLTPTDGMGDPNDFERILLGKMTVSKEPGRVGSGTPEGRIAKYKLHGDAGYILEE